MAEFPTDATARKALPVWSGVVNYFPDALVSIAELSAIGNEQHNPGSPLHWDRSKSGDEKDALMRHLIDAGTLDTDGIRHSTKVAWRALANLQKELEAEQERAPKARYVPPGDEYLRMMRSVREAEASATEDSPWWGSLG